MKPKLYTSLNCPNCRKVEKALKEAGIEYEDLDAAVDFVELENDCLERDVYSSTLKSAPVMITTDSVFEGMDCLVAIEFGEIN